MLDFWSLPRKITQTIFVPEQYFLPAIYRKYILAKGTTVELLYAK